MPSPGDFAWTTGDILAGKPSRDSRWLALSDVEVKLQGDNWRLAFRFAHPDS